MRVNSLLLASGVLLAATTGAQASGFQVNLVGTRNVGMASTGTGLYLDAASQYYNPGAFAFAPTGVQVSGNLAIPRLSYRSAIDQHVGDGNITFTGVPALLAGSFTATGFATTLRLPDVFSVGLGIQPGERLTIGLDANYVRWSRYEALRFDYTGGTVGGATSSVSARQYQDALAFRAGLQYKVTDGFTLRGGAFYDMHCVKDGFVSPETPDADRIGLSAGLSYEFASRFGIDASFLFENLMQRSQTQQDLLDNGTTDRPAGTYKTTIAVPGVGLHFNF